MHKIIEFCDNNAIHPRPMYILSVGHEGEHVAGDTLIDDAAHQMSPFSGAEANLAMQDGLELGIAIEKLAADVTLRDYDSLEAVVKDFEVEMCTRARAGSVSTSAWGIRKRSCITELRRRLLIGWLASEK